MKATASKAAPKVGIVSLGCPKALVDSERILTKLRSEGYVVSDSYDGADVVIYGTGFAATEFLAPLRVTGRGGVDLHDDRWKAGAHAYLGLCVPEFPNLFVLYGPNTNLGGSSIINMLESQSEAITTLLRHAESTGADTVAVRPEAEQAYDEEIQARLADSVWAGCASWYREDGGRITTNWPGTVAEYKQRCAELDLDAFVTD